MTHVKIYNRKRPTAEELWGRLDTLYTAHMKQEAAPSNTDSGAAGSDHFTLASPNAGQRRAGNQPLWWEWASNNGFVSGKFRTLYGGTPHPSPSQNPAAPHPNRRRAGQRSSLDLGMTVGMGTILPFSRSPFLFYFSCFFHGRSAGVLQLPVRAFLRCPVRAFLRSALPCFAGRRGFLAAVSLSASSGWSGGGSEASDPQACEYMKQRSQQTHVCAVNPIQH